MTRTYRFYINGGISNRLFDYIGNSLASDPVFEGRIKVIRIERSPGEGHFDYELLVLAGANGPPIGNLTVYYDFWSDLVNSLINPLYTEYEQISED